MKAFPRVGSLFRASYEDILRSNPDFDNALSWARAYRPSPGAEYGKIAEYALRRYEDRMKTFGELDAKATEAMKYSSAFVAFVGAIATVFQLTPDVDLGRTPVVFIGLSLFCFILSAVFAVYARMPMDVPEPGSTRQFLRIAADTRITDERQVVALIAAARHCAVVGLGIVIREKARRVAWATTMALCGLLGLIVATIGIVSRLA